MKRVNNVKLAAPSLRCEVENSVSELNIEFKNDNVQKWLSLAGEASSCVDSV